MPTWGIARRASTSASTSCWVPPARVTNGEGGGPAVAAPAAPAARAPRRGRRRGPRGGAMRWRRSDSRSWGTTAIEAQLVDRRPVDTADERARPAARRGRRRGAAGGTARRPRRPRSRRAAGARSRPIRALARGEKRSLETNGRNFVGRTRPIPSGKRRNRPPARMKTTRGSCGRMTASPRPSSRQSCDAGRPVADERVRAVLDDEAVDRARSGPCRRGGREPRRGGPGCRPAPSA